MNRLKRISGIFLKATILAVVLAIPLVACAEQCKSCNFSTGSVIAFLIGLLLAALGAMFLFALIVYAILNAVLSTPKKNMWFTWCGTIVGGLLGLISSFTHYRGFAATVPVIFMALLGAFVGYYFTPKRKL